MFATASNQELDYPSFAERVRPPPSWDHRYTAAIILIAGNDESNPIDQAATVPIALSRNIRKPMT